MAVLTVQKIQMTGVTPNYSAADSAGDSFANGGRVFLHVKNGDAAEMTVTVDSVRKCDQGYDHDITVNVGAGSEAMLGPFDPGRFNDTNGRVNVTYSSVTSVTVAALEV